MTVYFRMQPAARKVMLPVSWDLQGPVVEHYEERAEQEVVWDVGRHTEASSLKEMPRTSVRLCIILAWWCLLTRCHLNQPKYWNPPASELWNAGTSFVWPDLAPLCYHFSSIKRLYESINFPKTDVWRNLYLHELLLSQGHFICMCTEVCLLLD